VQSRPATKFPKGLSSGKFALVDSEQSFERDDASEKMFHAVSRSRYTKPGVHFRKFPAERLAESLGGINTTSEDGLSGL